MKTPSRRSERRFARTVLACFLPGLLAGTQVAGVLFFLNPHLPFDLITFSRGALFYGSLLGLLSFAVLLPLTRGREDRLRRWLPVFLMVSLVMSALGFWANAYTFNLGSFLPPGIIKRLLKAAIWLSLGALICFYTVIWHLFRRRPYGRRGRLVFTLVTLATVYVVVERREAFRPRIEPTPRATTFEGAGRPMLSVVGIETATFDAVLPLAEQGRLPFFSKMLNEGAQARLLSLRPAVRSPLWTTLATGKQPYNHGIVGEFLYDASFLSPRRHQISLLPIGISFEQWGTLGASRPVESQDLRALPIWQVLSQLGMSTALVGWPATSPPPDGVDVVLSNHFFTGGSDAQEAAPLDMAQRARLFRPRPDAIDPVVTARFGAAPPQRVLEALAADLWRQDLAFFLLDRDPPIDGLFLQLPGLEIVSHDYFGGYSAVQFEAVQEAESVEASRLVEAYYGHLDEFLSNLWDSMPEPRLLVVVSAHGVHGDQGWRKVVRGLLRRPPMEGHWSDAPDGVLMVLGEGIQPGASVRSAELVDVLPTILYGLGYPIARDFDGGVLTDLYGSAFLARRPLVLVPSYETFTPPPKP
ncbi:MAG: alkaline phosphatase family protein [Acidobacteriota bacterium]